MEYKPSMHTKPNELDQAYAKGYLDGYVARQLEIERNRDMGIGEQGIGQGVQTIDMVDVVTVLSAEAAQMVGWYEH